MCDEKKLDLNFKNSRNWIIILDNMNKKNNRVSLLKSFCMRDQLKYVNKFFFQIFESLFIVFFFSTHQLTSLFVFERFIWYRFNLKILKFVIVASQDCFFNASINEFVYFWTFHMMLIQFANLEICHYCVEDRICNIIFISFS
jgi:hypothetical protein